MNKLNSYLCRHDWLVPVFLVSCIIVVFAICVLVPDPKPTNEDVETVKEFIVKMKYEGHSYLLYKRLSATAICHDENCKCKEK